VRQGESFSSPQAKNPARWLVSGDDRAFVDNQNLSGRKFRLHRVEICLGDVFRSADAANGKSGGSIGEEGVAILFGHAAPERSSNDPCAESLPWANPDDSVAECDGPTGMDVGCSKIGNLS